MKRGRFTLLFVTLLSILLCLMNVPTYAMSTQTTPTLEPDKIKKGMTGYGKTVFEGNKIDTFDVVVEGVLENVMPDFDLILIRAKRPILERTQIMSGMSGSPIFINGKLIGALAYSWPFAKEPIAGVTPISNILESNTNRSSLTPDGESMKKIASPIVATGFIGEIKDRLSEKLAEHGLRNRMITGGSSGGSSDNPTASQKLKPGSALGIQMMTGDLSMTSIGTVTHRKGDRIYGFGHQFLNAGRIEFPLSTATVHTSMPSVRNSFKLASARKTIGTIDEDRRAAVVGTIGNKTDMLPVSINLSVPSRDFSKSYSVNVIRNQYLTPSLINSAAANFAKSKINELGINRLRSEVSVNLKDKKDLHFEQYNLISGSFDPLAFLPIASIWSNKFSQPRIRQVSIDLTLIPDRKSASINNIWLDRNSVNPGENVNVYFKIDPYRQKSVTQRKTLRIPKNIDSRRLRFSVIPASKLIKLEPAPESLNQLVERFNSFKGGKTGAILMQSSEPSLQASGHRMNNVPRSIAGTFKSSLKNNVQQNLSAQFELFDSQWILSGSKSVTVKVNNQQ